MEPIEPFFMPLYKCKNCGEIISQSQLKSFRIIYNKHYFSGSWCLCDGCVDKLVNKPKYLYFSKSFLSEKSITSLKEVLDLMLKYKVNTEDMFFEDEEIMREEFLGKNFEYGGKIGDLIESAGDYKGVYIIVKPKEFKETGFNENHYIAKHNGKNLNYSLDDLKEKWIKNVDVLYIGKSQKTVKERMLEHIEFYNWDKNNKGDNNVRARGGRSIGQINNYDDLEVWYLKCDNPDIAEKDMLQLFRNRYKKLPFANRRL